MQKMRQDSECFEGYLFFSVRYRYYFIGRSPYLFFPVILHRKEPNRYSPKYTYIESIARKRRLYFIYLFISGESKLSQKGKCILSFREPCGPGMKWSGKKEEKGDKLAMPTNTFYSVSYLIYGIRPDLSQAWWCTPCSPQCSPGRSWSPSLLVCFHWSFVVCCTLTLTPAYNTCCAQLTE